MQIEYEVKESGIAGCGLGLFARQFIPKGTLIWKYKPGVNVRCYRSLEETRRHLSELSSVDEQAFFMSHVYLYDGCMNEILDDGKYWNHSETPNTGQNLADLDSSYAIRDIEEGEELLDDYGCYEYPDWYVELAEEFSVRLDFIVRKDATKPGFHVTYEIRESSVAGKGIFATQFIPQGALIWKYCPKVNVRTFRGEEEVLAYLSTLSEEEQRFFVHHIYVDGGLAIDILDDANYWNHSENPNTSSDAGEDRMSTYAARDIEEGEELLDDYGCYEYPTWFVELGTKYGRKEGKF